MVQKYQSPVRVYKYPFELVMMAYEKRFPTCKLIPIFVGSDILSEFKSEDGAKHVIERRCKLNVDAPYLLKKIAGVEYLYFIQRNSLDWRERTLHIEAWNETFSSRVIVHETCSYSVHPENSDWTCFEQSASLDIKHFLGFENSVEKFAVKHYATSIQKGKEIIQHFLDELIAEGVTHVPRFDDASVESAPAPSGDKQQYEDARSYTSSVASDDTISVVPSVGDTGAVGGLDSKPLAGLEMAKLDDEYIHRFLGSLTLYQESQLLELRKMIRETHKGNMPSDPELLRFLRAREFNIKNAFQMLCQSLAWRKQHRIDHLLSSWEPPQALLSFYPGGWHYSDNEGRPLYVIRLGNMDVKGILRSVGEEAMVKHVLSIMEEGLARTASATRVTGQPISSWTCLLDLEGLSMRHLWRPGVKALLTMIEIVEANYPETMGRMLIVRAPRVFPVLWTLISPFIDENTRKKFIFYSGTEYLDPGGLEQYIDETCIPDIVGGDCICDIPDGGLVPKSMYRSTEDLTSDECSLWSDTIYKSTAVSKGQPHELLIQVDDKDCVITWDFDVMKADCVFTVFRAKKPLPPPKVATVDCAGGSSDRPANTVIFNKHMVMGIDYSLAESQITCRDGSSIQGSHVARYAGSYILQWKYHCPPHSTEQRTHQKAKIMYYTEVLASKDFRGSMSSLQSSHSGFSSHSGATSTSGVSSMSATPSR